MWGRGHGVSAWTQEGGGGAQGAQGAQGGVRQETRIWVLEVRMVLQLEYGGWHTQARDVFAVVSRGLGALRVFCLASLRPLCPGTWPSSVVWALHSQVRAAGDRGLCSRL